MTETLRPRPALNLDNAFYFEALDNGRLVSQQCAECSALRHPPTPCCPSCHSFEWQEAEVSQMGELVTFTVLHHPVIPPFRPGYIVGLVEFVEGVRIVMNLEIEEHDIEIGMPVEVRPHRYDRDLTLPAGFLPGADDQILSSVPEQPRDATDNEKEA